MTTLQIIALGFFGAVIWFIAAMFIRLALPLGWLAGGLLTVLVFAGSLPTAAVSIELAHRLVGGGSGQRIKTAAIISLVGLLLDGIAITWTPALYSPDRAAISFGGAWLLWTVGLTLVWALVRDAAATRSRAA